MRIIFSLVYITLFVISSSAQTELQKCAEKKNIELLKILREGKGRDSSALVNLSKLVNEWGLCVVGKDIPGFSIKDYSGNEINTAALSGKIIVANFWFTSCLPCVAEIPALNKLVEEYNNNVFFIAFTFNKKNELKEFLAKNQFNFTIVPKADAIEELFGVEEHPTTFIIDQNGKVRNVWAGASISEKRNNEAYDKIKPFIDELLKTQ